MLAGLGVVLVGAGLLGGWLLGRAAVLGMLAAGTVFLAALALTRGFADSDGSGSGLTVALFYAIPIAGLVLITAVGALLRGRRAQPEG